jgi:hypothetical protein
MSKMFNSSYDEPGSRDSEAGIQYYFPKQGVNPKSFIPPLIEPRILDQDVWGKSSTVRSGINKNTMRDITEESIDVDDMNNDHSLGNPVMYQPRTPNSLVPQNKVGENTDHGWYNSGGPSTDYGVLNRLDFNKKNNNFNIVPTINMFYNQQDDGSGLENQYDNVMKKTDQDPHNVETFRNREQFMRRVHGEKYGDQPTNNKPYSIQEEGENKNREKYMRRVYGEKYGDQPINNRPTDSSFQKLASDDVLKNEFRNNGTKIVPSDKYYDIADRSPPIGNGVQYTPVTDQLLQQSPTYVFTDKYFNQPDANLFLQDVQPKLYSYSIDPTPINSNIGITYAPQDPPRVLNQIEDQNMAYPLFSRVDPQLVRKDGTPGMRDKNPVRTNWSAEYSDFQAPEGSINFEDIYDPRHNSYGDPYRSYSDINLGQVQYYYSDIDAYKRPNFITRTNVDFIDFRDPTGKVKPYYTRTASLDEVRDQVENERMADEIFFRQDIMSAQMSKRNAEMIQLRQMPLRRTANSSMTYGPT